MLRIIALALAFLYASDALAQDHAREENAARRLQSICTADATELWGADLCGPLLVVTPQTRAAWASEADREGVLTRTGDGWTGVLPAGVAVANTSVDWAGVRWIMLVGPLPEDDAALGVLVAHEAWHRAQAGLGLAAQGSDCAHLETERGRTLLRLEMRALRRAMATTGRTRWQAARDALAFRAARMRAFPEALAQEGALDRNEGLASYTGVKLGAGADAHAYAAADLAGYDRHQAYARAYAYATGPAYGRAPGWRAEVAAGDAAPAVLLARRLRVAPNAQVDRAATRYGRAEIAAEEAARAEAQRARIAELRARFAEGPRLVLPLGRFNFDFDPTKVTPVEGLGSVYQTLTLRDGWGELTAAEGVLISSDFQSLTVATPAPGGLAGPGWTLRLAPGFQLTAPDARGLSTVRPVTR